MQFLTLDNLVEQR